MSYSFVGLNKLCVCVCTAQHRHIHGPSVCRSGVNAVGFLVMQMAPQSKLG